MMRKMRGVGRPVEVGVGWGVCSLLFVHKSFIINEISFRSEGKTSDCLLISKHISAGGRWAVPEHDQRFLHRVVIDPASSTRLVLARWLSGEYPYRMLAVIAGHLRELIQDHLLANPIGCLITLSDSCCQFPTCGQLDPSPHFRLPAWFTPVAFSMRQPPTSQ